MISYYIILLYTCYIRLTIPEREHLLEKVFLKQAYSKEAQEQL